MTTDQPVTVVGTLTSVQQRAGKHYVTLSTPGFTQTYRITDRRDFDLLERAMFSGPEEMVELALSRSESGRLDDAKLVRVLSG